MSQQNVNQSTVINDLDLYNQDLIKYSDEVSFNNVEVTQFNITDYRTNTPKIN